MSLRETVLVVLRRWRLSVPALILSVAAAVGAFMTVAPSYTSERQLLILPSATAAGIDEATNPFLNFGSTLVSTAGVLQLTVMTPQVVSALEKQGAGAAYEVTIDGTSPAPIMNIIATDHDPALTTRTVAAVAEQLRSSLISEQQRAGAPRKTWITTNVVYTSPKPQIVRKSQIRAVILAAAGSLGFFLVALFLLEGRTQRKLRLQEAERDWPSDQPERPSLRTPAAGTAHGYPPAPVLEAPLRGANPVPPIRPVPQSTIPRRTAPVAAFQPDRPAAEGQWAEQADAAQIHAVWASQQPGYQDPRSVSGWTQRQASTDDDWWGERPAVPANGQAGQRPQPAVRPALRLKNPQASPETSPNGQPAARPSDQGPARPAGQQPGR